MAFGYGHLFRWISTSQRMITLLQNKVLYKLYIIEGNGYGRVILLWSAYDDYYIIAVSVDLIFISIII